MDQLPDYMRICFLVLYNTVNEMALDVLKEQGLHIIKYLTKAVLFYHSLVVITFKLINFVSSSINMYIMHCIIDDLPLQFL